MKKFKFILILVGLLPIFDLFAQSVDTTKINYFDRIGKPKSIYNQQANTPILIPMVRTNDKFEIPLNEEKIKKFIYKKKLKWMNM